MAEAKVVALPSTSQRDPRVALLLHKTDLIAELASAVANQFNNIMMAVSSYAELEIKKVATPEKRAFEQIANNAERATSLIQKLLAFSRKHVRAPRVLSLNELIEQSNSLVKHLVGDDIEVLLDLDSALLDVKADPIELEQLLLSFALTSRSAMSTGGRITISTRLVDLDEGFSGLLESAGPGKYVLLSVGEAPNQPGSGVLVGTDHDLRLDLALRASREVVRELRGLIRITSDPRSGAKVEIYLPGLEREASVPQGQSTSVIDTSVARTILVVEDDDAVRIPAAEFLKMEGFKVLQARTGKEAMHAVLRSHSPIDLLVTDVVMPEMGGREVAQALLEIHPQLKVLYMSGDSDKARWAIGSEGAQSAVLQKPFRLQVLKDKIDSLLSRESESTAHVSIE